MMAGQAEASLSPGAGQKSSILRNRNFRRVFAASAVSTLGTPMTALAIPLTALGLLDANAAQMGLLGTLTTISFMLFGLPAGVLVDRVSRRTLMVVADFGRALVLLSIPVAWLLDGLTLTQMYAVAFVNGTLTLFFSVSSQSFLPSIVPPARLAEANAVLSSFREGNGIAGSALAGLLIQLVTAPVVIVLDALSYLWSGTVIALIGRTPEPVAEKQRMTSGIMSGLRYVFTHEMLRPIAVSGAVSNVGALMTLTLMPILYQRVLALPAGALGLFMATGGAGALLGSYTGHRLARRVGEGRVLWMFGLVIMPFAVLVASAGRGPWQWISMAAWLVVCYQSGMYNVLLVSFRQRITPGDLLGRMNATMRFTLTGATALGAALAGTIGQLAGVREALYVAAAITATAWIPYFLSPMRHLRRLP
ncbi:MFS transporter [Nonomuraea sp. WAC 01424]|uniref:MFS transporter n=1 Tax=Nonomuraea sp. WAC 01424 TaxID=2203200 RepID=UPI000F78937E|nr:MFS transporter [Nonomuraea sp. WAC 01424]RSN15328.1 MFS transporter [Nonomuraea sp. WAC 01424]